MPCDCPDHQPRRPTPSGSCNYLIYSGGPLAGFYRLVAQAIPEVEMVHGRPKVQPDGSLEFAGPAPALFGYRHEGSHLYPACTPCALRMLKVQVIDGALSIAGICGSPEAEHFSREVALHHCQDCSVRQC